MANTFWAPMYYPATKLFNNIPPENQKFKSRYKRVFKALF